jgi:hypothetical protein
VVQLCSGCRTSGLRAFPCNSGTGEASTCTSSRSEKYRGWYLFAIGQVPARSRELIQSMSTGYTAYALRPSCCPGTRARLDDAPLLACYRQHVRQVSSYLQREYHGRIHSNTGVSDLTSVPKSARYSYLLEDNDETGSAAAVRQQRQ